MTPDDAQKIAEALDFADGFIQDFVCWYAEDMCSDEAVSAAKARIVRQGGLLAYSSYATRNLAYVKERVKP